MAKMTGSNSSYFGLGVNLSKDGSIAEWVKEAGFDWNIKETNVRFNCDNELTIFPGKTVLYRSDNGTALSIVSMDYKVVQPFEVMEFFSDLVGMGDMSLESAGVMFDGRRFWAQADTGNAAKTRNNDNIKGNLILVTSCDGTLATNAMFVAKNSRNGTTIRIPLLADKTSRVRVTHARTFDPLDIKDKLGLIDRAWEDFIRGVTEMDKVKVSKRKARDFVYDLIANPKKTSEEQTPATMLRINQIVDNHSETDTMWDLVSNIAENIDNSCGKTRIADNKLWNTWYGKDADLKEQALQKALGEINV